MPTPSPIDHDVQRCRHFLERMTSIEGAYGPKVMQIRATDATVVLPHIAAVLAELERLRNIEADYGIIAEEFGEAPTDADKDPSFS